MIISCSSSGILWVLIQTGLCAFVSSHLWRGRSTETCGTRAGVPSPPGPAGTPGCKTGWRCGCKLRGWLRRRPWHRRTRWPRARRWGCGSWLRPRAPAACRSGSGWSIPMLETQWSLARRLSAGAGGLIRSGKWRKTRYSRVSNSWQRDKQSWLLCY